MRKVPRLSIVMLRSDLKEKDASARDADHRQSLTRGSENGHGLVSDWQLRRAFNEIKPAFLISPVSDSDAVQCVPDFEEAASRGSNATECLLATRVCGHGTSSLL